MASMHAASCNEAQPQFFNEAALNSVQAAFEAQHPSSLIYAGSLREQNLYHVTRMVAKDPECLNNHVRRVYLCITCKHRAALLGALIDLFLVLRGRGDTLFHRLLNQSAAVLGDKAKSTLEQAFESNNVSLALRLPLQYSVLSNGKDGSIFRL